MEKENINIKMGVFILENLKKENFMEMGSYLIAEIRKNMP